MPESRKETDQSRGTKHMDGETQQSSLKFPTLDESTIRELIEALTQEPLTPEGHRQDPEEALEHILQLHRQYAEMFRSAPIAYISLTSEGIINHFNAAAVTLLALEEESLSGTRLSGFIAEEYREQYAAALQRVFHQKTQETVQLKLYTNDDKEHWVEANMQLPPQKNGEGASEEVLAILRDITEHKKTQAKLEDSRRELSALVDSAPFTFMMVDTERRVRKINSFGSTFAGKSPRDLYGTHPGDALRCIYALQNPKGCGFGSSCKYCTIRNTVLDSIKTGQSYENIEAQLSVHSPEGTQNRTVLLSTTPVQISGELRVLLIMGDITERKQTEEQLRKLSASLEQQVSNRTAELERQSQQLRKVMIQLSEAEDRERQRLSELLHDDLQQHLVAIKFKYKTIARHIEDAELRGELEQSEDLLQEAISKTRNLSHQLRPPVLHKNGLVAGLKWLSGRMQHEHDLQVDVHAPEAVHASDSVASLLYKIVQETLLNVVKHAEVERATVQVTPADNELQITVRDQGQGFVPEEILQQNTSSGIGLISIRERIESIGGALDISSAPGKGTECRISSPLYLAEDDE